MASAPKVALATFADLLAIPEEERFHEVIHGEIVRKALPTGKHGRAQTKLAAQVDPFDHRPGGRHPGGWWFAGDVEIEFGPHEVYRPDIAGWRRERLSEPPDEMPIRVRPDWVCEILSQSNAKNDRVTKFDVYRRCAVPHYWIVDPEQGTLTVHRWTPDGYLVVLNAARGERVRAEPFEAIELAVGVLFGDEGDD